MKIFITGATGYIGRSVAAAFRRAGHAVYGLVRSNSAAAILSESEIIPIIGDLSQPDSYSLIAEKAEVLVHCAFDSSSEGVSLDKLTLQALIAAANKHNLPRTIIYTSGVWVYGNTYGKIVDEATPLNPLENVNWRPQHEDIAINASHSNLHTVVIRPGCVYGGVGGLTQMWFDSLSEGAVKMIGDGRNRWSMIHVEDLANLYVLAAEKEMNSIIFNATDGSQVTVKEIVAHIAAIAGIPEQIRMISPEEANKEIGPFSTGLLVDQMISSQRAQRLLGWSPRHLSFLHDIERYYEAWKSSRK